jgi:DNA invertase Pin-like site-specific DNA recombinase
MAEKAARWFRVSSGGQDEANQFVKVDAHVLAHGYEVARTFTLHGDSAFHGEQEPELAEVLADIAAGLYSVVVVRHSDRLDRRDPVTALMYALQIMAAGGRVESVEEAEFGKRSTVGLIQTTLSAVGNNEESRKKSERVKDAHARSRANGALTGKLPWGFASKGAKFNRHAVTTAEGERYAPEAFQRIADGTPLPAVARDLSTATGRTWHPRTVAAMIRNTTYRGEHRDAAGRIVCQCPELVTGDLWDKANANLDARPSARRGQRFDLTDGAALLSGIVYCGNPECTAGDDSPMYKLAPPGREPVYRCSGRGAQRKGCGFLLPVADADTLMNRVMSGLRRPVLTPVPHPAEGHQIELDNVERKLRDLAARGLDEATEDAERARLRAERRELMTLPMKAAWTEFRAVLGDDGEPVTTGSKWASSDQAERRTWLRNAGFAVYLARPDMTSQAGPDDVDAHPGETFSRTDVYTSDSAALIFEWAGDEDAGLGRALN